MQQSVTAPAHSRSLLGRKISNQHLFILLVLFGWTVINLCTALRYEPWRDVAQAWMIARQLNLAELFDQLKREGHPCLWYLVLMPYAKAGLPFYTVVILSFSFMFLGIWQFLRVAPVGRIAKVLIVFSGLGIFYLPVEARSYSMVPLLLMLLYSAYPARHSRPVRYAVLLFLLCQTHVLFCGLAGMLMLQWGLEAIPLFRKEKSTRLKALVSLLIMAGAVFFLYWQLSGSSSVKPIDIASKFPDLKSLFLKPVDFFSSAVNIQLLVYLDATHIDSWIPVAIILLISAVAAVWVLWLLRAPKSAVVMLSALLWHAFIHLFIYSVTSMRFILMLLWVLLLCLFLARDEMQQRQSLKHEKLDRRLYKTLIACALFLCLLTTLQTYSDTIMEINDLNSASKEAAEYIENQLPENAVILIENEIYAAPVAAWCSNSTFYNPIRHNDHVLSRIDSLMQDWCVYGDLDAAVAELRQSGVTGALYLLVNLADEYSALYMSERSAAKLEEVTRITNDVVLKGEEQYIIYRIVEAL